MIRRSYLRPVRLLALIFALGAALGLSGRPNPAQGSPFNGLSIPSDAITQQKVVAPDGAAKTGFGYSAALSDDGSTALVGTYFIEFASTYPIGPGKVYGWIKEGDHWSFQQQLPTPPMPDSDLFGYFLALSADGNTALVGAQGGTGPAETQVPGAAYVFTRNDGIWEQQAILTAADRLVGDHFGVSVALSDDGATALIGAYADDVGDHTNQGSAYVFKRNGTVWSQQAQLTALDGATEDYFGRSVSLSADGGMALIGADFKVIDGNTRQGAAYIFSAAGELWTQQARITAQDGGAYNWFGASVGLSSDGQTALVGAEGYQIGAEELQGAAFIFTRSGVQWSQQAILSLPEGTVSLWGTPLALSPDGHSALIQDGYIFQRNGDAWETGPRLLPEDGTPGSSGFGSSVALTNDGASALIGAASAQIGTNKSQGAAYFFAGLPTAPPIGTSLFIPLVVR
jgi:hypothetical protein